MKRFTLLLLFLTTFLPGAMASFLLRDGHKATPPPAVQLSRTGLVDAAGITDGGTAALSADATTSNRPAVRAASHSSLLKDHHWPHRPARTDGREGIWSIIAAGVGLVLGGLFALTQVYVLMLIGICFGIVAIVEGARGMKSGQHRGLSIAGLVLGIVICAGGALGMLAVGLSVMTLDFGFW